MRLATAATQAVGAARKASKLVKEKKAPFHTMANLLARAAEKTVPPDVRGLDKASREAKLLIGASSMRNRRGQKQLMRLVKFIGTRAVGKEKDRLLDLVLRLRGDIAGQWKKEPGE